MNANYRHDDFRRAYDDHRGGHDDFRVTFVMRATVRMPVPSAFRNKASARREEGDNAGK